MVFEKIVNKLFGGNTLFYPGCLTRFASRRLGRDYEAILRRAGIDFIVLDDAVCCGSPVLNAGYPGEFKTLTRRNKEIFRQHGIRKVITGCPACYHIFSQYYSGEFGVEHITEAISKAIGSGRLVFSKQKNGKVTYHDPCHLGRQSGIYSQPRGILKKVGFEVVEMQSSGEHSLCCGGGAGLVRNFSSLADSIAKKRIAQAESAGVKKMVTTCPMCFEHMRANSKKIRILELSEAVAGAL